MASGRIGNSWLTPSQDLIDLYVAKKNDPTDPGMDDRSFQIFNQYRQDAENASRLFNIVTNGPKTYKLFTFQARGATQIKQDLDYLLDTWGPTNDLAILGSWWNDTGIQGGMQPGENEGDPPTGTPFYPIPNNAYLFMPEEDGATSNADLRDVVLMMGQAPRDFDQVQAAAQFFRDVDTDGDASTPARTLCIAPIPAGTLINFLVTLTDWPTREVIPFFFNAPFPIGRSQITEIMTALILTDARLSAVVGSNPRMSRISPVSPTATLSLSVYVDE